MKDIPVWRTFFAFIRYVRVRPENEDKQIKVFYIRSKNQILSFHYLT